MKIKTNKTEINISCWLVIFVVLAVDSMYSNHCKKSTVEQLLNESSSE